MKLLRTAALAFIAALSSVLVLGLTAAPAQAQASRTWVSGVGDDVNPCSRTAPCKTFAGAISKTAAGGEINCLDPAGYGAVTVTKSITIDCEDTQGAILASSTTGVLVNGASINVVLRGLSINGGPITITGLNGVRYLQAASLTMEKMIIQNFNAAAPNGSGIIVNPTSGSAKLFVSDSTFVNNGTASGGAGISIVATGSTTVTAILRDVRMLNNPNAGFRVDTTGNTSPTGVRASLSNVTVSGSTTGVSAFQPVGAAPVVIMIGKSTIANNTSFGLLANGTSARIRIGDSEISNNGTAAGFFGGGVVNSFGNNQVNDNTTTDGAFQPNPFG